MKQEPLFDLVKSLNGHEKRYFNIFAKRNTHKTKNNYLRLFELVNAQETYDEIIIKETLSPYIKDNVFAVEKNYLYKMIIKSLNFYYSELNIKGELKNQLQTIEILYNKTLYSQAIKQTNKAKKIAVKHELFNIIVELINWEVRIYATDPKMYYQKSNSETLLQEKKDILETLLNDTAYQELEEKSFSYARKSLSKDKIKLYNEQMVELLNHELLSSEDKALSKEAKIKFHKIKGAAYYILKDREKSYIHFKKTRETIITSPIYGDENPIQYLNTLNNFFIACSYLNKKEEQKEIIQEMKTLEDSVKNKTLFYRIFSTRSLNEVNYYIKYKQFGQIPNIATELDKDLSKIGDKLNPIRSQFLEYNLACSYIYANQPKNALKWINAILNRPTKEIPEDIFNSSKILYLIIHYELENWDFLDNYIRSVSRNIRQGKSRYKVEFLFIKFITTILQDLNNEKTLNEQLNLLKTELVEISNDTFEKQSLELFYFMDWIDNKINKKDFC